MVNAPLIADTLGLRIAGLYSATDGYYVNRFDNHRVGATGHLVFLPSSRLKTGDLDLTIRGEYVRDHDDGSVLIPCNRRGVDPRLVGAGGSAGAGRSATSMPDTPITARI